MQSIYYVFLVATYVFHLKKLYTNCIFILLLSLYFDSRAMSVFSLSLDFR